MSGNKKELLSNLMTQFQQFDGGSDVEEEFTSKNPNALKHELQSSFEKIFPELMKKSKYRKHVIFDEDVYKFFVGLSEDRGPQFSSLINSALRAYLREKIFHESKLKDPVAELLKLRDIERDLIKTIKKLNLTEELKKKLG